MDIINLPEKKIEEGKLLLSKLDKAGRTISAGFWLLEKSRRPAWKLYLASPDLNVKEDLLKARHILSEAFQPAFTELTMEDIQLIPLDHPFITNIAQSIQTGYGITGMRLTGNQFDELFVEDLYIYRMNAS